MELGVYALTGSASVTETSPGLYEVTGASVTETSPGIYELTEE